MRSKIDAKRSFHHHMSTTPTLNIASAGAPHLPSPSLCQRQTLANPHRSPQSHAHGHRLYQPLPKASCMGLIHWPHHHNPQWKISPTLTGYLPNALKLCSLHQIQCQLVAMHQKRVNCFPSPIFYQQQFDRRCLKWLQRFSKALQVCSCLLIRYQLLGSILFKEEVSMNHVSWLRLLLRLLGHLLARSWQEVEDHLEPYPSLLEYFRP